MFYLCTGFHRSGTSLLAQTLLANGVQMGDDLMPATFSNPLGHVEDMPLVRLHDKLYQMNCTDWRYTQNYPLIKPPWLTSYIKSYINQRSRSNFSLNNKVFNGAKDPRAVHFLEDWKQASHNTTKYILIYRHWSTACFSLLNRQSRHFINSSFPLKKNRLNMTFWQEPTLVFKMWLSANQHIHSFYRANAHNAILISQEAFTDGKGLSADIANKIGLNEQHFKTTTLQADLLTNEVPQHLLNLITPELEQQLTDCYKSLESLADLPSAVSTNSYHKKSSLASNKPVYKVNIQEEFTTCDVNKFQLYNNKIQQFDFSRLTWPELCGAYSVLPETLIKYASYNFALQRPIGSVSNYDSLSKVAYEQHYWVISKLLKIRAIIAEKTSDVILSRTDINTPAQISSIETVFDMSHWLMHYEKQSVWLGLGDADLVRANPFSIIPLSDLPSRYEIFNSIPSMYQRSTADIFLSYLLQNQSKPLEYYREILLASWLLINEAKNVDSYLSFANYASEQNYFHIEEFCLLKALRCSQAKAFDMNQATSDPTLSESGCDNVEVRLLYKKIINFYKRHNVLSFVRKQLDELPSIDYNASIVHDIEGDEQHNNNKPIRHRFALFPVNNYERILQLGEQHANRGKQLDLLNRRLCFLAKNNIDWLNEGTDGLALKASYSLIALIEKHWKTLWAASIFNFLMGIEQKNTISPISLSHKIRQCQRRRASKQSPQYKLLAHIQSEELLHLFIDMLLQSRFIGNVELELTGSARDAWLLINDSLTDHIRSNTHFSVTVTNVNEQFSFVQALNKIEDSDYVGILHSNIDSNNYENTTPCSKLNSDLKVNLGRLELILRWYAMLGFEDSIDTLLAESASNVTLPKQTLANTKNTQPYGLVMPSYHHARLLSLQNKPLFYPDADMMWIAKNARKLIKDITAPNKHQFKIKMLHVLKEKNIPMCFMHQLIPELHE